VTKPQRETTRQIAVHLDAALKLRMDAHLYAREERQRAFLERAIARQLDEDQRQLAAPNPPGS
jgi:hypothetical protein